MIKSSLILKLKSKDFQKFITYAICFISVGIGVSLLGPLLPFLAARVNVSLGQISFAFTAQNLGYMIGSVGGSRLYDRFKSHKLMVISLSVMVLVGLMIPVMTWFYTLLFVLFLFGLGLGMLDVGGNLSLVWIFKSQVSPYMNAIHFSFGVGAFFTPIIIATVMSGTGGRLSWAIWTLVILFCPGFIGLFALKSPKHIPKDGVEGSQKPLNYRVIVLLILLFFFTVGVQLGFGGWIFTYVSDLGIADVTTASLMTSIFWGSLTVGRLVAIPVSKKVSPESMLLFHCALLVFFMGMILIWPMDYWMMWVGSAGMGIATSVIFPTSLSFAETRLTLTGRVTGMFFLGASLGMMLVPMLLGQVYEFWGGYEMMVFLFIGALIGLAIMIRLRFNHVDPNQAVN